MSNISTWSETAANNNAAAPNGFPEGMAPSGVNDGCREMMGAVRRWTDDGGWHNWGDTCSYNSATSFVITGVDATARYHTGRRIRAVGTVTGTIYGTVSSSSFVSDTTVNVTWDSGSLASESLTISLGFLAVVNTPIPAILLAGNQTAAGVKTFSSFPVGPSAAPTTNYQLSNKKYVDDVAVATLGDVSLEKVANKGIANGYASLGSDTKVPTTQLGGSGADNTKYLRGDQTWQVIVTPTISTTYLNGNIDITVPDFYNITVSVSSTSGVYALSGMVHVTALDGVVITAQLYDGTSQLTYTRGTVVSGELYLPISPIAVTLATTKTLSVRIRSSGNCIVVGDNITNYITALRISN